TGVPASTSVLALNKALEAFGIRRLGLVSPYLADVQSRIIANYAKVGIDARTESHLGIQENFAFALVDDATLDRQVADVVAAGAQAITTFCTSLYAGHRVAHREAEDGVPVYDTVPTVVWDMLRRAGVDPRRITGWARPLQEA